MPAKPSACEALVQSPGSATERHMAEWKQLSNLEHACLRHGFATLLQSMYSLSEHNLSTRTCMRVLKIPATKQVARHVYPWGKRGSQRRATCQTAMTTKNPQGCPLEPPDAHLSTGASREAPVEKACCYAQDLCFRCRENVVDLRQILGSIF